MMKFLRTQMKWIMAVIVVAFLLSTFLMYEGRGTRRTPSRNPDGTMADYEVAQINGRSLMRSELEQRLRNYLSTYSTRSMTSIDMPAIYRSVLDQAILESQLTKEVQEKGITVSDAEADQAMKNYADTYFPTREAFYQVLANSGLKPEDYKKSLARQMAADRLMREAIGDVTVSGDRAVEYYETMKAILFSRPEGFMIHMADFNNSADAENFRAKIADGGSWDVVVSNDTASMDIINITRTPVMLPSSALTTGTLGVLASLDIGTVSPVFEISSGDYAVAMKASHVEAGSTPYDEVSGDIKMLLTQQEERNRLSAYEESLRQKASVVINDEELFASPVTSKDNEQSGDVLPIMIVEETSEDEEPEEAEEVSDDEEAEEPEEVSEDEAEEVPATVEVVSEEKTEETPATVEVVSEEKTEEAPAPVEVIEDKTEETPAPVEASEDKTEEAPAPIEVSEDKPEETPAPVEVSEDKPEETPAPVEVVSEEKVDEDPVPAEISEDKPEQTPVTVKEVREDKTEEVPAPVEVNEEKTEEAPAPVETLSEDETATVSQDISSEDTQQ